MKVIATVVEVMQACTLATIIIISVTAKVRFT